MRRKVALSLLIDSVMIGGTLMGELVATSAQALPPRLYDASLLQYRYKLPTPILRDLQDELPAAKSWFLPETLRRSFEPTRVH